MTEANKLSRIVSFLFSSFNTDKILLFSSKKSDESTSMIRQHLASLLFPNQDGEDKLSFCSTDFQLEVGYFARGGTLRTQKGSSFSLYISASYFPYLKEGLSGFEGKLSSR